MNTTYQQIETGNETTLRIPGSRFYARIIPDSDPLNPRQEYDNLCLFLTWHGRYNLGDKPPKGREWDSDLKSSEAVIAEFGTGTTVPLYLYDHSGLTVSTKPFSCPWDSGQIGWVYLNDEKALSELGSLNLERVSACIEAEVETYDQYLRGDVWVVETFEDSDSDDEESLECVYGFFGFDYAVEEAKDLLKFLQSTPPQKKPV